MNNTLTIVLPIHNGESHLRREIGQLLELAGELTNNFSILLVDDGSTDDTFEIAGELAAQFPQVTVLRQSVQRGLGPTIERIRSRINSEVVMVYDGSTPMDVNQIRQLWRECGECKTGQQTNSMDASGSVIRELAAISATHQALEHVHHRILGFHLITSLAGNNTEEGEDTVSAGQSSNRRLHSKPSRFGARSVAGNIPPLPRPNFLEAVTDFALGE